MTLPATFVETAPASPPAAQSFHTSVLEHSAPPVVRAGEALPVELRAVGRVRLSRVTVFARSGDTGPFTSVVARPQGDAYVAVIPATLVQPPFVEYHFRAQTQDGTVVTLPEATPETNPIRVTVATDDPGILVLTPEDGETDVEARPQIAVLFDPPLDSSEVATLTLDDRSMASERSPRADYLSGVPGEDLTPGRHTARVVVERPEHPVRWRVWSFTVAGDNAGTSIGLTGRVSLGLQSASGEDEPEEVRAFLPEPPGVHVIASADVSGVVGSTNVSGWLTSAPGFSPQTAGAVLGVGPWGTWEVGSITPILSEIALSGPVAWGARVGRGGADRSVDVYALYVNREADLLRYATPLAAAQTVVGVPRAHLSLLGVFGQEGGPAFGDVVGPSPRRGWTIAPGLLLGDPKLQLRTQVAISRITSRDDGNSESAMAEQVEVSGNTPSARGTMRLTLVPADFVALGAPYLHSGRRELVATSTVGRTGRPSVNATYRVAKVDSTLGAAEFWTHQADMGVSWYAASGSGGTLSLGSVDGTSYQGLRGAWVTPRNRLSAEVMRSSGNGSRTWSGSTTARGPIGKRLITQAGISFSSVRTDIFDSEGETTSGDVTPNLLMTWTPSGHYSVEAYGSYSHRKAPFAVLEGTEVRTFDQVVLRASLARSF